ncbi:hypothetical protein BBK36DRAFT_1111686 [Trichoderma citrinoviride]|uniref:C2H2-type domain-containing protein n=1 Tax=Trichoderma citrinoviride TaxID=58853 RepID=A0A2T4BKB3_9HYPO|nr:hypothetical protein BBK36DRAFT_1111686 [Trichoderma citrinoviride]PTB69748.1 hypothetical protein BBK36DRAFT_1111686 [Trichoderma citrinoviride]
MAAQNCTSAASSLPPYSTPTVVNGGRLVYDYEVPASLTHAPMGGDHLYQPIDPMLRESADGGQQLWGVQDMSYFQQPSSEACLDPSLAPGAAGLYQPAVGRNDSPFSFQPSPAFSLIESPSIGSDANYEIVDPATPPDAHLSLGNSYDSDYSYDSNVEQSDTSFYPDSSYYGGVDMVTVNGSYVFGSAPNGSPLMPAGNAHGGHMGSFQTTLPYVSSARHIKEESLPPSVDEKLSAAKAARRRPRSSRCDFEPVSCKRASPDDEGSSQGEKRRKTHITNKRFCHKCKKNFQSRTTLDEHTNLEHPRPYICVFHYAGCTARFDAKNEWKRHVSTKHLGLKYWVCTEGKCAEERQSSYQRYAGLPLYGNIFNRKDLYTQHIRRMHATVTGQGTTDYKGADARSDCMVKKMQEDALRIRCRLPTWMPCPVQSCDKAFTGANAWDERMEHVAQQHFDNAAAGREPPVEFGGPHDTVLTEWAQRSDIRIVKKTEAGWELCDPLKGDTEYRMATPDDEE